MNPPRVMFGVGATKSGTSWLHQTLAKHPQCHLRSIKELHYFDALDFGELDKQRATITRWRDRFAARLDIAPPHKLPLVIEWLKDRRDWLSVLDRGQEDPVGYLAYLRDGAPECGVRLVGDITPAYALLSEERLRAMSTLAPDVRFVYLMRDPVARLWSHVRMICARRTSDGPVDPARALHILGKVIDGKEPEIAARGDYRAAVRKLRIAVPKDRLLCLFYEDVFDGDGMARLCDFLEIDRIPGEPDWRVHQGTAIELPDEARARAAAWLSPQYRFVARITKGDLPTEWQFNVAPS